MATSIPRPTPINQHTAWRMAIQLTSLAGRTRCHGRSCVLWHRRLRQFAGLEEAIDVFLQDPPGDGERVVTEREWGLVWATSPPPTLNGQPRQPCVRGAYLKAALALDLLLLRAWGQAATNI